MLVTASLSSDLIWRFGHQLSSGCWLPQVDLSLFEKRQTLGRGYLIADGLYTFVTFVAAYQSSEGYVWSKNK